MNFSYLLLIWLTLVGIYHNRKPLPDGVDYQGPTRQLLAGDIEFIKDMTYLDQAGNLVHDQEIFNSIFTFIDSAATFKKANNFVRQFDKEFGTEGQQFDLILFYDGNKKSGQAFPSTILAFRKSWKRPDWYLYTQKKK